MRGASARPEPSTKSHPPRSRRRSTWNVPREIESSSMRPGSAVSSASGGAEASAVPARWRSAYRRPSRSRGEDEEPDTDADRGVGEVEGGEGVGGAPVPVEEVDDATSEQAVDEVADDAAGEEAGGDARKARGAELAAVPRQEREHRRGDARKQPAPAREHAPGRAVVQREPEVEEAGQDRAVGAVRERARRSGLGELVERDHDRREDERAGLRPSAGGGRSGGRGGGTGRGCFRGRGHCGNGAADQ